MPSDSMSDERFDDALIYISRHSVEGAWGFVINRPSLVSVGKLLNELGLPATHKTMNTLALEGGVLRPEAGFVLHTGLPNFGSGFAIAENICLTTSKDILAWIAHDRLPHYLLCMGFCGWIQGQLEAELANGDWLVCPADLDIIFRASFEDRLDLAYQKLGIDRDKFTTTTGFA